MANDKSTNTWVIDTSGIIHDKPICIRKAILFPNAAANSALFKTWDENGTPELEQWQASCTVTGANQIVSTGNFATASVDPGDIIKIVHSAGAAANLIAAQILANADNNTITIDAAQALTNEASKEYHYKIWTPTTAFKMVSPGTEKMSYEINFAAGSKHGGTWFANLSLDDLSASAVIHLFIA